MLATCKNQDRYFLCRRAAVAKVWRDSSDQMHLAQSLVAQARGCTAFSLRQALIAAGGPIKWGLIDENWPF